MLKILRHKQPTQRIAALTKEIEELRSKKARSFESLICKNDSEIGHFKKDFAEQQRGISEW